MEERGQNGGPHSQAPWISTTNAEALPTHIPYANRPGWTSSDAMQQQSDNINFCINKHPFCHPCLKPNDDDYLNHQ
ncbi:unnamed protein product [Schistocephalus solidus]|uniref:Uncharacterized protein n=1 Tax=Schistocephalus solidus TaxID=70667 RepID=A0A183TM43_SCHSO|nr:unnamed protein product [Schistocephalus solidus]